ncbi:response regulator [Nocardiopsis flavescens]|uniref:DNA-binding response regulator, NarL/FixJ family, contains REC and HTH domains n=1 Tax=Nocardiopsis flavescens TaxID=758803 RepID=A0A1M6IPB8_9ACTN|nr:response regulator transcription factor [Nocardiopsis flavescens]SHJ36189.1 DNA-binding response regulator, NarL/FixJ family, contains REC and HTH domains [Nocardiopsis flavescens]
MRIVVVEDLYLLRDGLVRLLQAYGHEVVATAGDGPTALRVLREHRPDVAVVDVRLPPTFSDEGLQVALRARRDRPGLPVLILSQHIEQLYARELLAEGSGGVGYLLKDRVFDAEQFIEAVERVARGGTSLDPAVVAKIMNAGSASPLDALTARERDVIALMAEGLSNQAIARRLFLSEGAISKHTTAVFAKLGVDADVSGNRRVRAVLAFLGATGGA